MTVSAPARCEALISAAPGMKLGTVCS
jgi:hypothetical protein